VESLKGSDLKFEFNIARTLGQMGGPALDKLIKAFENTTDAAARSLIIFSMGKIKDPVIRAANQLLIQAATDPDQEVRDSAVRTIGKMAEVVSPSEVPPEERDTVVDVLFKSLGDPAHAVRAKAVRSLAKLAHAGFLTEEQRAALGKRAHGLLGHVEEGVWDRAYIVRKEAEFALQMLGE